MTRAHDRIAFLRKLQALATQGIGGEAENAKRILNDALTREGLTQADLEDEPRVMYSWIVKRSVERTILAQICYKLIPDFGGRVSSPRNKPWDMGITMTQAEYSQVDFAFSILVREFRKEEKRLLKAFVLSNDLFPADPMSGPSVKPEKNREEIRKILGMAEQIEATSIRRALPAE